MKHLVVAILAGFLGMACTGESRYVLTESDVAARDHAKATGMDHWVDTEQKVHALTCVVWQGSICAQWDRDNPPNTFDCTDDQNAYPGEILFFDKLAVQNAHPGWNCAGINESYATSQAFVGDYNDNIRSMKNRSSNIVDVYENQSFGGALMQSIWQQNNGWQLQDITSSNNARDKVSSFARR